MSESYRALCSDFYVNLKLGVKMELPRGRDTVLELFERTRKQFPAMGNFKRYRDELALESPQSDAPHRWIAVRANSVRAGSVNPPTMAQAYGLHEFVLDTAPVYLNISPLDIECVELLFGFDLAAAGNHDGIVFETLVGGSPLAKLSEIPGASLTDYQPIVGMTLKGGGTGERGDIEAHFEIKTRPSSHQAHREGEQGPDPISVYLTLRRFGSVGDLKELPGILRRLAEVGDELAESRVVPHVLVPLRDAIASGNA